jgi:hypothetical protein
MHLLRKPAKAAAWHRRLGPLNAYYADVCWRMLTYADVCWVFLVI